MGTSETLNIDGRMGEGGGQVLRSALALSLCTGRPVQLEHLRGRRSKPGLMRQHLACVRAAAEVSNGEARGAELGSTDLWFAPGRVCAGSYRFSVGSAGSAGLVLQTVLMPLMLADGDSEVTISGGTHNAWAPPWEFLRQSFLPQLEAMGARVELDLERVGFYPAGRGVLRATIRGLGATAAGVTRPVQPLELMERGSERGHHVVLRQAHLPRAVVDREWEALRRVLHWDAGQRRDLVHDESPGPGNSVHAVAAFDHVTEVVSGFGARNRRAEGIGREVGKGMRHYLATGVPVGEHLADQLLLPMVLLAGGRFRTLAPTRHTSTNVDLIHAFLPDRIEVEDEGRGSTCVRVRGLLGEP